MWICGTEDDREGHKQEGWYYNIMIIIMWGGVTEKHYLPRLSHVRNILHSFLSYDTLYYYIVLISSGIPYALMNDLP